jgi:hypothetical protein
MERNSGRAGGGSHWVELKRKIMSREGGYDDGIKRLDCKMLASLIMLE